MTTMQYLGGTLIRVEANQFGDAGTNGGDLTFMANNQGFTAMCPWTPAAPS